MWTDGEEVQQIDGGHETGSSRLGPGMDTRAMVEAQHRVGCIGKQGRNGEAGRRWSINSTIPQYLHYLYVSTFQNSIAVLISRIRWLEILSRCRRWRARYFTSAFTLKSGA